MQIEIKHKNRIPETMIGVISNFFTTVSRKKNLIMLHSPFIPCKVPKKKRHSSIALLTGLERIVSISLYVIVPEAMNFWRIKWA
jgi:hypothetical protein